MLYGQKNNPFTCEKYTKSNEFSNVSNKKMKRPVTLQKLTLLSLKSVRSCKKKHPFTCEIYTKSYQF